MEQEKITSIQGLKQWNDTYQYNDGQIESKPIVLEWFLDWFFDEALDSITQAKEAFDEMIRFTIICERVNKYEALGTVLSNLNYWYSRASKFNKSSRFKKFKAECL